MLELTSGRSFKSSVIPPFRVESERLTSSSQEVQKKFVVKAVRDPRTGKDVGDLECGGGVGDDINVMMMMMMTTTTTMISM